MPRRRTRRETQDQEQKSQTRRLERTLALSITRDHTKDRGRARKVAKARDPESQRGDTGSGGHIRPLRTKCPRPYSKNAASSICEVANARAWDAQRDSRARSLRVTPVSMWHHGCRLASSSVSPRRAMVIGLGLSR